MNNEPKPVQKDRHKKIFLTCNDCLLVFPREQRKMKNFTLTQCRNCMRKKRHKLAYFPTKKLKEIIGNAGFSDVGTDFEHSLPDIQEEYANREQKALELYIKNYTTMGGN